MEDLVSVIITTYNRKDLIEETIQSCLQQTYKKLEIIVVDDGSTDDTGTVLTPYTETGKIKYIYQQNAERAAARNNGARKAKGAYLKFLDSDDLLEKNYVETCIGWFQKHPDCDLVYTNFKVLINGHLLPSSAKKPVKNIYERLWEENDVAFSSVMMKTDAFFRYEGFNETRSLSGAEDWEFWVRISKLGCRFCLVPDYVTLIRSHDANGTMNDFATVFSSSMEAAALLSARFNDIDESNKRKFKARFCFLEAIYLNISRKKLQSFTALFKAVSIDKHILLKRNTWILAGKLLLPTSLVNFARRRRLRQLHVSGLETQS